VEKFGNKILSINVIMEILILSYYRTINPRLGLRSFGAESYVEDGKAFQHLTCLSTENPT
jgi:hypothetical protein